MPSILEQYFCRDPGHSDTIAAVCEITLPNQRRAGFLPEFIGKPASGVVTAIIAISADATDAYGYGAMAIVGESIGAIAMIVLSSRAAARLSSAGDSAWVNISRTNDRHLSHSSLLMC